MRPARFSDILLLKSVFKKVEEMPGGIKTARTGHAAEKPVELARNCKCKIQARWLRAMARVTGGEKSHAADPDPCPSRGQDAGAFAEPFTHLPPGYRNCALPISAVAPSPVPPAFFTVGQKAK